MFLLSLSTPPGINFLRGVVFVFVFSGCSRADFGNLSMAASFAREDPLLLAAFAFLHRTVHFPSSPTRFSPVLPCPTAAFNPPFSLKIRTDLVFGQRSPFFPSHRSVVLCSFLPVYLIPLTDQIACSPLIFFSFLSAPFPGSRFLPPISFAGS